MVPDRYWHLLRQGGWVPIAAVKKQRVEALDKMQR
jgi:hypothetical protein